MTLFSNDSNPAMRYEGLARAAFGNCNKGRDPRGYASQDRYVNSIIAVDLKIKRALSTVLIKLIFDNASHPCVVELKKLEDRVWDAKEQREIVRIVDEAIKIYDKFWFVGQMAEGTKQYEH